MLPKTVLALAALALSPVEALWPVPVKSSLGDKTLWIDQTVAVTYNGKQVRSSSSSSSPPPPSSPSSPNGRRLIQQPPPQLSYTAGYAPPSGRKFESQDIVQGGVARTFEAIFQKGLVPWMISEKGDDWEPATGGGNATRITKLAIEQTKEDDENNFKPLAGDVDESYSLSVGLTGEAKLKANSSIGVLRGLETFSQLFFQHSSGSSWYTQSAPVEIEDAPKYPHRGVLLDVARHWFEVDDIKRTIDGLAMNKMNVLHLHITDTQSWPLEVPALPRLHEVASYRKGMYYSTEEIASIYEYGVHRGVQVIMEIDMPGHVGIEEAYPGLTVAYKERPYQWYCAQPPCGSLKLNDTGVEDFLDTLFDDLLPRIAPYTAYFHTGGDEYKANNSLLDPALETADHEVLQPLLQRFLDHAHAKVREHGLVPFVWEEMVLEWNATLGEDVVIQSWLGNSAIKELAEAGHKVIDSSYEFYVSAPPSPSLYSLTCIFFRTRRGGRGRRRRKKD